MGLSRRLAGLFFCLGLSPRFLLLLLFRFLLDDVGIFQDCLEGNIGLFVPPPAFLRLPRCFYVRTFVAAFLLSLSLWLCLVVTLLVGVRV